MKELSMIEGEPGTVAHQIVTMAKRDQDVRARAAANHAVNAEEEDHQVDVDNTEQLKKIVADIGWPTASKVGPDVAHQAWLLVQHADHDVAWQQHCLDLMKAQPVGEVALDDIAYLEDRTRINAGRPQLYGTQFHQDDDGRLVMQPIEDPDRVDERRKKAGLEPLAQYQQEFLSLNQK